MTQRPSTTRPRLHRRSPARAVAAIAVCAVFGTLATRATAAPRVCGTRAHTPFLPFAELASGDRTNCSASATHPDPSYAEGGLYELRLVVHVIEDERGRGALSDEDIAEQVRVLNEDFRGLGNGAGFDTGFTFALASLDPEGAPTTGITRHQNDAWFADARAYWNRLAWDPERYVNVYTNDAGGFLGYSFLPADPASDPGDASDRVVVHFDYFGRNRGEPGNLGRTLTHELGHYLGLDHPFAPNPTSPETFVCEPSEPPACYTSGDLLCDTPSADSPSESCEPRESCGVATAIENFMDYTPDECMERFSPEQALRMRCTVRAFRRDLPWPAGRLSAREQARSGESANVAVELVNDSPFAQDFSVRVAEGDFEASFAEPARVDELHLEPAESAALDLAVSVAGGPSTGRVVLEASSAQNERPARLAVDLEREPPAQLAVEVPGQRLTTTEAGEARFLVSVENLGVVDEELELRLSSEWPATLVDGDARLAAFERRDFEVRVTSPDGARPSDSAVVSVEVATERDPAVVERREVTVQRARWVAARLTALETPIVVRPSTSGSFSLGLQNLGNAPEAFRLVLDVPPGVEAWPESESLGPYAPLGEAGTRPVRVRYRAGKLDVGERLRLGASVFRGDAESAVANTDVELWVVSDGNIELAPERQRARASGDQSGRFVLTLRNATEEDDVFDVAVEGESLVERAPPAEVAVAAGESVTLQVELLPRVVGATEPNRLRVASQTFPERKRTATLVLSSQGSAPDAGPPACPECDPGEGAACSCRVGAPASTGWPWLIALALACRRCSGVGRRLRSRTLRR